MRKNVHNILFVLSSYALCAKNKYNTCCRLEFYGHVFTETEYGLTDRIHPFRYAIKHTKSKHYKMKV